MSDLRVRVLVNPAAAGGKGFRAVGDLVPALRRYDLEHEILLSRGPRHLTELAEQAREDGVDVVAVVGGDGSLHEVVQAYLGADGRPVAGPDLALIPLGTGSDFARTLGLSGRLEEAVARIRFGHRRPVDLGMVALTGHHGEPLLKAFVNIASFGLSGVVDAWVTQKRGVRLGRATFLVATLGAMATYKAPSVRVTVDGVPWFEGKAVNVAVANGRWFGGGMQIAPQADPSDGRFEVVALGDLTPVELLNLAVPVYTGTHLGASGVRVGHGAVIEAEPAHPWATVLADVDGEPLGRLPMKMSVAKGALGFRC